MDYQRMKWSKKFMELNWELDTLQEKGNCHLYEKWILTGKMETVKRRHWCFIESPVYKNM